MKSLRYQELVGIEKIQIGKQRRQLVVTWGLLGISEMDVES